ncbi:MAG: CBS domain-containing protein [Pirellulales bacterium]
METAVDRLQSLTVHDVMARGVFRVAARQPMSEVARQLLEHGISSAPVVDEQGVCVGILSATDFLRRDAVEERDASVPPSRRATWQPDDVAATYMTAGVQSVPEGTSLLQAARIMTVQHVHRLPVIDSHGRPLGIISTMDIIAALLNALQEQEIAV